MMKSILMNAIDADEDLVCVLTIVGLAAASGAVFVAGIGFLVKSMGG